MAVCGWRRADFHHWPFKDFGGIPAETSPLCPYFGQIFVSLQMKIVHCHALMQIRMA
jgi:hypothetical protein